MFICVCGFRGYNGIYLFLYFFLLHKLQGSQRYQYVLRDLSWLHVVSTLFKCTDSISLVMAFNWESMVSKCYESVFYRWVTRGFNMFICIRGGFVRVGYRRVQSV